MHEIHVFADLCDEYSELLFRFCIFSIFYDVTKRVKDASAHNQKTVLRNCGMWPVPIQRKPILLGPIRWVDVPGRALRRAWIAHWRRQYVEVLPLADSLQSVSPPSRPPRAVCGRQHRWSWHDRLRHAMLGGDHRSGASLSLAFPLFSSPASRRRKR